MNNLFEDSRPKRGNHRRTRSSMPDEISKILTPQEEPPKKLAKGPSSTIDKKEIPVVKKPKLELMPPGGVCEEDLLELECTPENKMAKRMFSRQQTKAYPRPFEAPSDDLVLREMVGKKSTAMSDSY